MIRKLLAGVALAAAAGAGSIAAAAPASAEDLCSWVIITGSFDQGAGPYCVDYPYQSFCQYTSFEQQPIIGVRSDVCIPHW